MWYVYGLFALPWWGYLLVALLLTHLTIITVTVFLHRHQAHLALDLHPAVSHFFRFWLWLTTGMRTRQWVAVHRKHHARVETPEDPHSPRVLGIRKVLWEGAELYRQSTADPAITRDYGHGCPDDWLERHLYTPHDRYGLGLLLTLEMVLFGWPGLAIWAIQMAWIPFFAAGVINGLGHWWGYRNFECPDGSTNLTPMGCLIGGEELHNNHHAFPKSARFSIKSWEFDLGWQYIRLLRRLGLARVKRVAPRADLRGVFTDVSPVQGLLQARFHVLARYAREVVNRVCRQQRAATNFRERYRLRRARKIMNRDISLLDSGATHWLRRFLRRNEELGEVYLRQQELQDLWCGRYAQPEQRLQALRAWCCNAEKSGIQALREFGALLRRWLAPAMETGLS